MSLVSWVLNMYVCMCVYSELAKKNHLQRRIPRCSFHTRNRASHNQTMPTNTTVPFGTDPFQFNILKSSLLKPLNVFFFLRKKHPHVSKEAREPEGWVYRTDHTSYSSKFQHPICFLDSTLRIRPIFDTGKG